MPTIPISSKKNVPNRSGETSRFSVFGIGMYVEVEEMKELIESGGDYLPWLSRYLVMKRVSIEPNFHHLYNNFLAAFDCKALNKLVETETYRNVKV